MSRCSHSTASFETRFAGDQAFAYHMPRVSGMFQPSMVALIKEIIINPAPHPGIGQLQLRQVSGKKSARINIIT